MQPLRLAFAGTPDLAAAILVRLIDATPHSIACVYTQPDRHAGRGLKTRKSPVKILAEKNHLKIKQPQNPAEFDPGAELQKVDLLIVVAYGMLLPAAVLDRPKYGSINIHTSLLPRWRGAAPIQRAIAAGDEKTGITIMRMNAELDKGDILLQKTCPILAHDTAGALHERLSTLGGDCLLDTLAALPAGSLTPIKQDNTQATYAKKISKAEAHINWTRPALEIERLIRAFNPAPVAYTIINGKNLRIWQAVILAREKNPLLPGEIAAYTPEGLDIATGDKLLRILTLQLPGKKPVACREFYNGNPDFNLQ